MSTSSRNRSGASATQLTLVFINLLFVVLGLAGMVVGCWVLLYREEIRILTVIDAATSDLGLLQNAAILLITCGLVLFVLGFIGCCATYKSQKCLRVVYICLVITCCILTATACGVVFAFRNQVEDDLLDFLRTRLVTEYQGFSESPEDFSMALDWAQVEFECCGIQSYLDFQLAANWTVRNSSNIPITCCVLADKEAYLEDLFYVIDDPRCIRFPNSTNSHIDRPCYKELKNWMEEEVLFVGGLTIAGIVLQILAVLFMIAVLRRPVKDMDHLYRDDRFFTE